MLEFQDGTRIRIDPAKAAKPAKPAGRPGRPLSPATLKVRAAMQKDHAAAPCGAEITTSMSYGRQATKAARPVAMSSSTARQSWPLDVPLVGRRGCSGSRAAEANVAAPLRRKR